jgi:hypothetical protein
MEGNIEKSRQIMGTCKKVAKSEWKVYFEAVMMEMRNGQFEEAEQMVKDSIKIHPSTGRLWATLI